MQCNASSSSKLFAEDRRVFVTPGLEQAKCWMIKKKSLEGEEEGEEGDIRIERVGGCILFVKSDHF